MMNLHFQYVLFIAILGLCCQNTQADVPSIKTDAELTASIDAAVEKMGQSSQSNSAHMTGSSSTSNAAKPRREPKDFFHHYEHSKANAYPELSRRHMLIFSPPEKLEENERILLDAAEKILNPTRVQSPEAGGNSGGGKVLFLLVDTSNPENALLMHRCSVPRKTSKSGVLRIAQFPVRTPLEVHKPVGKYKVSSKYLVKFLQEVRQRGDGATRALMTEEKIKKFTNIDTSSTMLRAVGSTAHYLAHLPHDIVFFSYLPSCTHCKEFNRTLKQVIQECEAVDCGVKFVLMDASINEHALLDPIPNTYPQVHMFKAHEKEKPIEFDDFVNKARSFRYFIDRNRWYKDKPKLVASNDNGFQLWDDEIDPMNAKHFNHFLGRIQTFVVMFYVDSSPQSKLAIPEYAKAGEIVGFDKMPLIKIDCNEQDDKGAVNTKLCNMFELTGYPSIMYIDVRNYKQEKNLRRYSELLGFEKYNAQDIAAWITSKVDDSSTKAKRRINDGKNIASAHGGEL
jgi:hypothetical protein